MEKLTIIKVGGKLLDSIEGQQSILKQVAKISGKKILVHGGGVMITELCNQLGIETKMVNGRRVTSKENMDVVLMSCAGKLNKELTTGLNKLGCEAVGLCGGDLNLIQSKKRNVLPIDFGWVGDISQINTKWLKLFLEKGAIPVVSSITQSDEFQLLNTNADTIASGLATALSNDYQVDLFFYLDKNGVLEDVNDVESIIKDLSYKNYIKLKQEKKIHNGMLPKLDNGFLALNQGVQRVQIGNGMNIGTTLTI